MKDFLFDLVEKREFVIGQLPKKRKFNGKVYAFGGVCTTFDEAKQYLRAYREEGYAARTAPYKVLNKQGDKITVIAVFKRKSDAVAAAQAKWLNYLYRVQQSPHKYGVPSKVFAGCTRIIKKIKAKEITTETQLKDALCEAMGKKMGEILMNKFKSGKY